MTSPDKLADPDRYQSELQAICQLYAEAPALHQQGVRVVCTDEKTGIQALERHHPNLPPRPGQCERLDNHYTRHGTLCLIANFEVATGQVLSPSLGARRTEADFLAHIEQTIELAPEAEWVFVVDQLNTHLSESLVRLVSRQCGLKEDLGRKWYRGVLKDRHSRRKYLSDPSHRIRFVYTPRHTSWMNQVEIWFSILVRRALKRTSFSSLEALRKRILDFIDYFNTVLAKPFKWTYTGKPLQVD